jgi:predicted AAA+ superfamily ATPase
VVLLNGARQTGKTTLVQWICRHHGILYYTLDDFATLAAAENDPEGFLAGLTGPVAIDEVQRVPRLLLAIKAKVDRDRQPGQFLLTGSANVLSLPHLADTLVGRMEVISLWPFSQGEIRQKKERFIDLLFSKKAPNYQIVDDDPSELLENMLMGGYPELRNLHSSKRKAAWFRSYVSTLLQREVKELSHIEGLSEMPRLLSLLASRSGSLVNFSDLSRNLRLSNMTLKRYLALLQAVFITHFVPAWAANIGKRLIKSPKVFLNDTGLLAHLCGITAKNLPERPNMTGVLLENFVMQELFKQREWNDISTNIYYYRTAAGKEVDFLLESAEGRIVGIEVKSTAKAQSADFKGLKDLSEGAAKRFYRGILLYTGRQTVPFAENLHAVPISALWM